MTKEKRTRAGKHGASRKHARRTGGYGDGHGNGHRNCKWMNEALDERKRDDGNENSGNPDFCEDEHSGDHQTLPGAPLPAWFQPVRGSARARPCGGGHRRRRWHLQRRPRGGQPVRGPGAAEPDPRQYRGRLRWCAELREQCRSGCRTRSPGRHSRQRPDDREGQEGRDSPSLRRAGDRHRRAGRHYQPFPHPVRRCRQRDLRGAGRCLCRAQPGPGRGDLDHDQRRRSHLARHGSPDHQPACDDGDGANDIGFIFG